LIIWLLQVVAVVVVLWLVAVVPVVIELILGLWLALIHLLQ
jgi:hypothetical protein